MEVKQKGVQVKEEEELAYDQAEKKKKTRDGSRSSSSSCTTTKICQVDKCTADLGDAKQYHRRHRICEQHSKAQLVVVAGIPQRFCQQCSRFHELSEFDESKRSCRRRLAGHNERRRKNMTTDTQTEAAAGSARKGTTTTSTGTQLKDVIYGQVEERERIQIPIQEHHATNFKHFQIR